MKTPAIVAIFLASLLSGCGGKKEDPQKVALLTETRQELEELKQEATEVKKQLESAKSALQTAKATIAQFEQKERQRHEGGDAAPRDIAFSDSSNAVTLEILRILTGDQVVANAKLHAHSVAGIREQGKDVIYFEIKVTNNRFNGELSLSQYRFKLESAAGDTFSVEQTRDYIRGDLHQGRSARGGIAFSIYPDSKPKVLRFDTGLTDGRGTPLEAISPNLDQLVPQTR